MVSKVEQAAFDIDEASEADLAPPRFPPPPLTPEHVDRVVRDERLLPPGVECRGLDGTTFGLIIPGDGAETLVTARPAVLYEHCASLQLALPDGPIFRRLAADAVIDEQVQVTAERVKSLDDLLRH